MPFCTQCGSGVSGENCSNCGAENPHFRDPNAEPESAPAQVSVAPVERERARPWPLIESSLALAWPRLRKYPLWFVILAAVDMLAMAYVLPLNALLTKAPSTPAQIGHFYAQLAPPMFLVLAAGFVIQLLSMGEAARARMPEFRWTPRSIAALLGWLFLAFLGLSFALGAVMLLVLIPVIVAMVAHSGGATASTTASPAIIGATALAMFVTMIPLLMWLGTKIALLEPTYVLGERSNPIGASWKLTDGYFWETFGFYALYVLVSLGILIVTLGIGKLFASLAPLLALVGNLLEFAGAMWLQFAIAEGMVAWTAMLREAKTSGRQG
uniref:Uncharacterized protein n=1 Tax=mine drainage metagenome TaxID=410659 RepID=E6Q7S8_9ZZZZ